jgi:hypothetical protein
MKVRALKTFASPSRSYSEGDVFDVSLEQGAAWTRAGLVRPEPEEVREAVTSEPETAVRKRKR